MRNESFPGADQEQIEYGRYPLFSETDRRKSITLPMLMSPFSHFMAAAPFTEKFANRISNAVSQVMR